MRQEVNNLESSVEVQELEFAMNLALYGHFVKLRWPMHRGKSNRKAMNRNWSNQKANPALKTKTGNK